MNEKHPALGKTLITLAQCYQAANALIQKLELNPSDVIYGIPRGGIVPALIVAHQCGGVVTENIASATVIIDDLVDSGATADRYIHKVATRDYCRFGALFSKGNHQYITGIDLPESTWLVFPWEMSTEDHSKDDIVVRMLQAIVPADEQDRAGIAETPQRVVKAWDEWFGGYHVDLAEIFKTFEDGAEKCDEMVIVRDIPVYSHCEHHLAPFFGVAHIGYVPNNKIVGLSKLSRLVDAFAHRLQVQERLTNQIADAMDTHLAPLGVGVVIECRHMCMESRGIRRQGSKTITSAMRGALLEKPAARAEFMSLIKA
jgi:GTP cyclohydrolase I